VITKYPELIVVGGDIRWLKANSYYSIPRKVLPQPDGERAADPIIAEAEQVGGNLDPISSSTIGSLMV
jgi:hypothetical protein